MNIQTILSIVIGGLSVLYILGLGVFVLIKRHQNKKNFEKEVRENGLNDESETHKE